MRENMSDETFNAEALRILSRGRRFAEVIWCTVCSEGASECRELQSRCRAAMHHNHEAMSCPDRFH